MKRISLLLIAGLLLTGCETLDGYFEVFPDVEDIEECPGASGKPLHIWYGDSTIVVDHKVSVKKKEVIKIILHPDFNSKKMKKEDYVSEQDYEELEVVLVGKTSKAQWLNRKLKASDSNNKKFEICIGDRDYGTYRYLVRVPGVGQIDPRIVVEK